MDMLFLSNIIIVLFGLLPLIPTSSKPSDNFLADSTVPMFCVVSIVVLVTLFGLGSCSFIFTDENDKNPKL